MTAIKKYERLEATGLWKSPDNRQRVEVLISFGKSSLILRDHNEIPMAHWSLATLRRLNKGKRPALYAADIDGQETLEIEDGVMVDAIERVSKAIRRRSLQPGRLRRWLSLSLATFLLVAAIVWFPGWLANYATGLVPDSQADQIGLRVEKEIAQLTGPACVSTQSTAEMQELRRRLKLTSDQDISVMPLQERLSLSLPGNRLILNASLLLEQSGPEAAAGFTLLEVTRQKEADPLLGFFEQAGLFTTLKFLVKGELNDEFFSRYARQILNQPTNQPTFGGLLAEFTSAELTTRPFAHLHQISEEERQRLIDADPMLNIFKPVLSDASWLILQDTCSY